LEKQRQRDSERGLQNDWEIRGSQDSVLWTLHATILSAYEGKRGFHASQMDNVLQKRYTEIAQKIKQ
jgi:hypothetical protein